MALEPSATGEGAPALPSTMPSSTSSGTLPINLKIVSPSVSVNRPLNFPQLPSTTTVKDLKRRIREALDSRPSDDCQRLIYRGRALSRENDTLLQVLGEDTVSRSIASPPHLVFVIDAFNHHSSVPIDP
jgi:hypothetical protein